MVYIKVTCEYDFGGQFGSDNNEEIFGVPDAFSIEEINNVVANKLSECVNLTREELDGLYDWEFLTIDKLN